ncbi:hypothetical protein T492DRAFT_1070106 [Pavlovales sp. CCMP2436]|nr:hypothetical protein T492DRAFT_1070106 [Pavlovales sp. CCMP2436]
MDLDGELPVRLNMKENTGNAISCFLSCSFDFYVHVTLGMPCISCISCISCFLSCSFDFYVHVTLVTQYFTWCYLLAPSPFK